MAPSWMHQWKFVCSFPAKSPMSHLLNCLFVIGWRRLLSREKKKRAHFNSLNLQNYLWISDLVVLTICNTLKLISACYKFFLRKVTLILIFMFSIRLINWAKSKFGKTRLLLKKLGRIEPLCPARFRVSSRNVHFLIK